MKLAVIGGGAAGFFAAIQAAQRGVDTCIYEKSGKVLSKVKVSGGGRCNVTNVISEPALLVGNYPRGGKELRGPFTKFNSSHTRDWFEIRGVKLKAESDGRIFPVSDSSQTIIDCLLKEAEEQKINIHLNTIVSGIQKKENHFEVSLQNGKVVMFDKIIVASGGSNSLKSYQWLIDQGHTIVPPVPSLFTFNIPDNPFKEIMGVAIQEARIKLIGSKLSQEGPLLFTHWGISGPAVLKLSAWASRWLFEADYNFVVSINFAPSFNEEQIFDSLLLTSSEQSLKKVRNSPCFKLPSRLWEILCSLSSIDEDKKWAETSKSSLRKLSQQIVATELNAKGKTTFKEEFVTCGGVDLRDVNMQTMESKIVSGQFFAGEVLNIDGITGGFNFQAAWTSGFIAGSSV